MLLEAHRKGGSPYSGRVLNAYGKGRYNAPKLDLNYASLLALAGPETFTRSSLATQYNSLGNLVYAPHNQVSNSSNIGSWGIRTNYSVTANSGTDPLGGNTAALITNSGSIVVTEGLFTQSATTQTSPYVISIWLKAGSITSARLVIKQSGTDSVAAQVGVTLTSSWQRFSLAAATANGVRFEFGTDGVAGNILAWGPMIEQRLSASDTTPGPYVATSGSVYYGPRFDYDPVALTPRGLLIEESRTNLALQSNQFDTTWSGVALTDSTVVSGSGISPDGSNTAWKLKELTTTVALHAVTQAFSKAASALTYTLSFFAKAAERTRLTCQLFETTNGCRVTFDLANGQVGSGPGGVGGGAFTNSSASMVAVGAGWYRCILTATTNAAAGVSASINLDNGSGAAPPSLNYAGTVGFGALIYGAQLEQASFATSYIPTTTASVTRAADAGLLNGSSLGISGTVGTWVVEFEAGPSGSVDRVLDLGVNRPVFFNNSTTVSYFDGTTVAGALTLTYGAVNKVARSYGGTTTTGVAGGGSAVTGTFDGNFDVGTVTIGGNNGVGTGSIHIRRVRYFNRQLSTTYMQGLTT